VRELTLPPGLGEQVAPLLEVLEVLNRKIADADRIVVKQADSDVRTRRLQTFPGVGPVTAAAFVATLDTTDRFEKAGQVRAFLGLVPREYSSGESTHRGRITKAGNARLRSLLVEAAWSVLRARATAAAALRGWGLRVAARRGKRIAAVALARRIAGILYAMWRDGRDFVPAIPAGSAVPASTI
jgi:transposase